MCEVVLACDQTRQFAERGHVYLGHPHRHAGAGRRVEHPRRNDEHRTGRPLNMVVSPNRALLDPQHPKLATEIGMPPIMNFQIVSDMGRMNG
ncbi:hypothetical protein [uncultured Sphingomonas sp.]|uniref:hypothetical protein n=1 Tax=uncultured Sphingomonas sp. TaxID=158754 RepID=UPI0035C97428